MCGLVRRSTTNLKTYNQIMNFMGVHENRDKLAFIFACAEHANHKFVLQYLPLFCNHFGIRLFSLPQRSRAAIEGALHRNLVFLFGIARSDAIFGDLCALLGPE